MLFLCVKCIRVWSLSSDTLGLSLDGPSPGGAAWQWAENFSALGSGSQLCLVVLVLKGSQFEKQSLAPLLLPCLRV